MIFLTDTNNPIAVPAMKEGVTIMSGGKISSYEDDDTLYNYYVFDAAGDIVSFLETDKASGKMVQHVYTKTGGNLYAEASDFGACFTIEIPLSPTSKKEVSN